jgi:hypothetical protein
MKKNIFWGIFLSSLCLLTSCSLDETPLSKFSEEEAYKDSTLIYVNTVASIYSAIGDDLYGGEYSIQEINELTSDASIIPGRQGDWVDGGVWQNLFLHNFVSSTDVYESIWNYVYKMIGLCNTSIDKLTEIKDINSSAEGYIYELRALRAIYYYYAMDLYGQIPIVTSSTVAANEVKQSNRTDAFNFVVSELTECLPHLSTSMSQKSGEYYGRITKAVAYMYLAKCALNSPVYNINDTSINSYQMFVGDDLSKECVASETLGAQVSNSGKNITMKVDGTERNAWETVIYCVNKIEEIGYTLQSSYADNFSVNNVTSNENIWVVPNDDQMYKIWDGSLMRSIHYNHGAAMGYEGWNGSCSTVRQMKLLHYGEADQDPRLKINFYTGTDYTEDTNGKLVEDGATDKPLEYLPLAVIVDFPADADPHEMKCSGARFKKYEFDKSSTIYGDMNNDMVICRYGDALLMKAEAQYRLGDKSNAMLNINKIRGRVGATPITSISLNTILNERMAELSWEGKRRMDQIRFCTFTQPTIDKYVGVGHNASASDYNQDKTGYTCVFPIPSSVLSKNTNLKQNPGY